MFLESYLKTARVDSSSWSFVLNQLPNEYGFIRLSGVALFSLFYKFWICNTVLVSKNCMYIDYQAMLNLRSRQTVGKNDLVEITTINVQGEILKENNKLFFHFI